VTPQKMISDILFWAISSRGYVRKDEHEEIVEKALKERGTKIVEHYIKLLVDDLILCGFSKAEIEEAMYRTKVNLSKPLPRPNGWNKDNRPQRRLP
jgi:hypothetical protein